MKKIIGEMKNKTKRIGNEEHHFEKRKKQNYQQEMKKIKTEKRKNRK